jgi:aspartate ammonia-lyase
MAVEKTYYGEETRKAVSNFGEGRLPREFIRAYGEVKKAALTAIQETEKRFPPETWEAMMKAADLVIAGEFDGQCVLPLRQGGAGTSVNMLFNELIAGVSAGECGLKEAVDPIQDVNRHQSTNDTYPTALTVMAFRHLQEVEARVIRLQEALARKETEYAGIVLAGRTEMQSALPISLGQVFGAWAGAVERDRWRLSKLKERIRTVALGGTAIGTCFFAPRDYVFAAERHLREITGLPLCRSQNLPDEISNLDKLSELASGYRLLAGNLFKISGDLTLYTSSFIRELVHPELQYGSSIMAAKTNPVILEYARGLAVDVQGEYHKILTCAENGQLQLNPFLPFVTESLVRIHESLCLAIDALTDKFLPLMKVDEERIEANLVESAVLLNGLVPVLGYNKVKELFHMLDETKTRSKAGLRSLIMKETGLGREFLDRYLDPGSLTSAARPDAGGDK